MSRYILAGIVFLLTGALQAQTPKTCTLTLIVEGMSSNKGNLGVVVFNNDKGWPEDRFAALKDIAVPAQQGTQTLKVPDLPCGKYAVAAIHDENQNHKLDKNFMGMPKEQWGMSNNPHATLKAPPFSKAEITLEHDQEIHIQMQK